MASDKQDDSKEKMKLKRSKIPHKLIIILAEFLGTGLLMFIGCMGCITDISPIPIVHYGPEITFGFTVLLIIQMFGHISGAHLNPVVTLASIMLGYTKLDLLLPYLIGEYFGAIAGFGLLLLLIPSKYTGTSIFDVETNTTIPKLGICTTYPHTDLTVVQSIMIEVVITGVLVFVCCAVWDKRNADKTDSTAVRFGLVVAVLSMTAGPLTSASMNPARSFAPALLNNNWDLHWIYWVGPFGGAILSTLLYKHIFQENDYYDLEKEKDVNEELPLQHQLDNYPPCPNNVNRSTCNSCKPGDIELIRV